MSGDIAEILVYGRVVAFERAGAFTPPASPKFPLLGGSMMALALCIMAVVAVLGGAMLLLVGNGAVVWAEQWVPSGLVALLVATVPLWIVLVDWGWGERRPPGPWLVLGLAWGLAGVALLCAAAFARRIVRPLGRLSEFTRNLPERRIPAVGGTR